MAFQTVANVAATAHMMPSIAMMIRIDFAIMTSSLENFCFDPTELRMMRVSCPVYTTTPMIQSVFLRLEPRKRRFSAESEICSSPVLITPSYL